MKALYCGDNLQVLRDSIATESVDLIYLDPPFNSNAILNVGYRGYSGYSGAAYCTTACSHNRPSNEGLEGQTMRPQSTLNRPTHELL